MSEVVAEAVEGQPAPALRRYVSTYHGYRQDRGEPGTHQGLPSRNLTLVLSLAEPVEVVGMPDPAARPEGFQALVGGLHARPAVIAYDGLQYGIHVDLTPWAASALLGVPAGALAGGVFHLAEVMGAPGRELLERVVEAPDWAARFGALDAVLLARVGPPPRVAPEVAHAWDVLCASGGKTPVAAVAEEVGWSRRHLAQRFGAELGLSPKTAARVLRFERSRGLLVSRRRPRLADVAATAGYADQAHLTREWREIAGLPPTEWLAAELPFVQDAQEPAAAS